MQRSTFINSAVVLAAGCAAAACSSGSDAGLVQMAGEFDALAFEKLVSKNAEVSMVWDAGPMHPQILGGVKNGLNALQFGFSVKPDRLATAFVTHGDSNLLLYGDTAWAQYNLGTIFSVHDPGGNIVTSNIFSPARSTPNMMADPNDVRGFYQDAAIETLQKRGVMFFACNTALMQHAARIANAGASKGQSASDVAAALRKNLVPGTMLVPSGVGTVAYLQSKHRYAYCTEQG